MWAVLGVRVPVGHLGRGSWPMWAVLGKDQGLYMWAVSGKDQGPCGRSWVRIGAYVGRLARDQTEKWPKPERGCDLSRGSGPKSGPGPSGKAIWAGKGRV